MPRRTAGASRRDGEGSSGRRPRRAWRSPWSWRSARPSARCSVCRSPAWSRRRHGSLVSSASLFGVDAGTPQGLVPGYVFPLVGPHDFGDKVARFGAPRYGHVHEGQDIFGKTGTPEVAVHDGVVVDRGKNTDPDDGGRGNYIAIYSSADNHSFVYMHMLAPSPAHLGQQVHAGQVVGRLGCTGSCDGPHLHFEVRIGRASLGADTKAVDPLPYLRHWPQPTLG